MIMPREKTPDLNLPMVAGGQFVLSEEKAERGTLVCFYRGLHCPICANYLKELEKQTEAFAERGFNTIAISSDSEERAKSMAEKVEASNLRFAYGLDLKLARDWGLYISAGRGLTSINIEEPALFSEPGLFIVNNDQTLYYASVQTMPFSRPHFSELVGALDFVIKNDYPARGEFTGAV